MKKIQLSGLVIFRDLIILNDNIKSQAIISSFFGLLLDILDNASPMTPFYFKELTKDSGTNDTKLTNAKNALNRALLKGKFQNVIDFDNSLDKYYNEWSRENYPETNWGITFQMLNECTNSSNIFNNLAQFGRFNHLSYYDSIRK